MAQGRNEGAVNKFFSTLSFLLSFTRLTMFTRLCDRRDYLCSQCFLSLFLTAFVLESQNGLCGVQVTESKDNYHSFIINNKNGELLYIIGLMTYVSFLVFAQMFLKNTIEKFVNFIFLLVCVFGDNKLIRV